MMELVSPAFLNERTIPEKYTCKGKNISPPLQWKEAPREPKRDTKSFVLIMDDPDAPNGTWDHWVVYNIPSHANSFQENVSLHEPYKLGKNSWGKAGYGGPCPPSGTHRYFFKLYALDTTLIFDHTPSKKEVEAAMQSHILEKAELIGNFSKG